MSVPDCPGCRALLARNAELEARVLALEGQVRDLVDQLKPPPPPRAATPTPPAPAKQPTGKKPGGQAGHPPRLKVLLPPERVDTVIPYLPARCACCDAPLPQAAGPHDPAPTRHQVAELPALAATITEHQAHARTCPGCGTVTRAPLPVDVRTCGVGPRLTAVLSYFAGVHGVSKRGVEEIAEQLFAAPVALGTVANREQEMSAALAPAHEEARRAVEAAPVKHVDETGWKQAGQKRWLWVAATAKVVYFLIHPRRNLEALKRLVGAGLTGILCSDRWCVYDEWPAGRRQLCWAHLGRNWEQQVERGGTAARLGRWWLQAQGRLFEAWHLFRGGGLAAGDWDDRVAALMVEMHEILRQGQSSRDRVLVRFCARLRDVYLDLWTFADTPGVEPTNNHAERVQRRAVLWRRRSFGCHSADGCRFVERILTVVQSLRQQGRSVVEFLSDTITAHRQGLPYPQLLMEG
jgi:transposase